MKELSLHILDIAMNGVKAGATDLGITLNQQGSVLTITITDNGCGMDEETVRRLSDPFFTTRTTRKVGMGVPLFALAAQQTGGDVKITSVPAPTAGHGTVVSATFHTDHIDCAPLGEMVDTVLTLVQGSPEVNLRYCHRMDTGEVLLDTGEIKKTLGDEVPINSFEILEWIKDYLNEQYTS